MVCSMSWSWFSKSRGEPTCVCGCVWVERLEPEITLLTDVLEAIDDVVARARGAPSPQVFAYTGAVVVPGPQTDEVASPPL